MKLRYKDIDLLLCASFKDYEDETGDRMALVDAEGVEYDEADIVQAVSKEHFAGDDVQAQEDPLYWFAVNDEGDNRIVAVIVDKIVKFDWKGLFSTVSHEYGHIVDATDFKNSTAPYETEQGYEEEETKAIAFQNFAMDAYEMSLLFVGMFKQMGIEITGTTLQ